jgi:CBS domain-containing protein
MQSIWRDRESRVFPSANDDDGAPRVRDMPMRPIPVIPAHLSMGAARKVAALKQIAVLLVEREQQVVGTIDEHALAAAGDDTPIAAALKPFGHCLRPAMSVAQARELFIRARAAVLPVIAGGFVLGAVTRGAIERTKPHRNER